MPNDFDRIFKEDCIPCLIEKITGLEYSQTVELKDKIQITPTLEREADDFRMVLKGNNLLDHGLQFEVHLADEDLRARNQLHHAMFFHKFGMQLRQIVVFVGDSFHPNEIIKNRLPLYGKNYFEFEVYILRAMPVTDFLNSKNPAEIILGILADFGNRQSVEIIREILQKLFNIAGDTTEFEKYKRQLAILSKLRKLQTQTIKEIKSMPTQLFSIKDDMYFQEGKLEGMSEKTMDFIINLIILSDHDNQFIATIAGVRAATIEKIRAIIIKNPKGFRQQLKDMNLPLAEQITQNS